MKARTLPAWISGLVAALTVAVAPGGLAQDEIKPLPARTVAESPPQPASDSTPPSVTGPTEIQAADSRPGQALSKDGPPPIPQLSPWTSEIVKLAQAGIDEDILLSFIDNCAGTFNLGADQIIHLTNLGVSSRAINAMIQHDSEFACGLRTPAASTVPASEPAIRITFTAGSDASAKASERPAAPAAPWGEANIADDTGMGALDSEFTALSGLSESGSAMNDLQAPVSPSTSSQQQSKLYAVRQPYPEELLPPIIVIRAPARTPNVLVIDFSQ